ncbi:DUF4433 domain-containing protein [methanotrophic endosymbiont of Bathymodiolus puteoserpentis (Logatchev)]|jgi:hypothetical protein|uniref:DUF4433 domain-containing protein n=1 Tax=methanotrophic endosymbiont of Bathymodiolus puteoserpentis (Logatchev) TaxID=343235 RepID=UPI0013C942B2|nr:DUF4433 domain-containing protein [methanotrophic endosymbiont of Bathymodiolus puteoserpentis (Logatchev)]SHE19624.1 ADP-ribose 1''-phosphate phophatase related protein [methanotrophic endosymbiont of Bathymodiolus puteoserpentis (Logatchev)]
MNSIPAGAPKGVVPASTNASLNEVISQYDIPCLYHLTHINNLPGILANGLLSHNLAHQQCTLTDISDLGVNARRSAVDPIYKRSLHNYVPTYFRPLNPMSSARRELANELVILKLNPQLLLQSGMLFTDGNAACCNTRFFSALNDLNQLNWACLNSGYWKGYVDGGRQRCAEMLIPDRIQVTNIMQIAIKSEIALKSGLNLMSMDIQVVKQAELFF